MTTPFIKLFEHADYAGSQLTLTESCSNLISRNFNDKVSSVCILWGTWRLYEHVDYKGRQAEFGPGVYNIQEISAKLGNDVLSSVQLVPSIRLYEHAQFLGHELALTGSCSSMVPLGFNDKVSSVRIPYGTWKLYEHVDYKGRCADFGPGNYDFQAIKDKIGNDVVSSAKLV